MLAQLQQNSVGMVMVVGLEILHFALKRSYSFGRLSFWPFLLIMTVEGIGGFNISLCLFGRYS
jgi:hypothetical protein